MVRISSISEKPRNYKPRKLVEWLNPTGERKVHSLTDKILWVNKSYQVNTFTEPAVICSFVKAGCGKTARPV